MKWLAGAVVLLLVGCTQAPAATPRPTVTARPTADLEALAEQACADAHFPNCVAFVLQAAAGAPGSLIAVCDYEPGQGDVVLINAEQDAESMCSGDGLISPSRVVDVVRLP